MLPPQAEEDLKGGYTTPEEAVCLRWLLFLQYPRELSAEEGHRRFREILAPRIVQEPHVYRAFTSAALTQEIHLPGVWPPEAEAQMHKLGSPANHRWDRMVELWFQTFADWEAFVASPLWQGAEAAWSEHPFFPFLKPCEHMVSTFLLERPAFDWLKDQPVYR